MKCSTHSSNRYLDYPQPHPESKENMMNSSALRRFPFAVFLPLALVLNLLACSTPAPMRSFDFGPNPPVDTTHQPPPVARIKLAPSSVQVQVSPALETKAMLYRLLYENPQILHQYTESQWALRPAQLITEQFSALVSVHLSEQMSAPTAPTSAKKDKPEEAPLQLQFKLQEFAQHFSDAQHSQVQIDIEVSLLRQGEVIARRHFQQIQSCASPNAEGGAHAMFLALKAMNANVILWIKQTQEP